MTRRELVVPGAFLRRSVEIAILRYADFDGGGDQRVDQRMTLFNIGSPQGAVVAVKFVRAAHVVLELAKVRQHVSIAPTGISKRGPLVVVLALAANVDEAVDRRRAPERATARPVDLAPVHLRFGLGIEAPIHDRMEHRLRVADRNMDPWVAIARAGFQQQHRMAGTCRQSIGKNAARRSATDDHVVIGGSGHGSETRGRPRMRLKP